MARSPVPRLREVEAELAKLAEAGVRGDERTRQLVLRHAAEIARRLGALTAPLAAEDPTLQRAVDRLADLLSAHGRRPVRR